MSKFKRLALALLLAPVCAIGLLAARADVSQAAPTILSVGTSGQRAVVTWTTPPGESMYGIELSTTARVGADGSFSGPDVINDSPADGTVTITWPDWRLDPGTYYLHVATWTATGVAYSNLVSFKIPAPPTPVVPKCVFFCAKDMGLNERRLAVKMRNYMARKFDEPVTSMVCQATHFPNQYQCAGRFVHPGKNQVWLVHWRFGHGITYKSQSWLSTTKGSA